MQPLLDAMNAIGDDPAKQMTSRLLGKKGDLCRAEEELRVSADEWQPQDWNPT